MAVKSSSTVERLRARRRQQAGESLERVGPPRADASGGRQSKLQSLWSEASARMSASDVDEAWARLLEETLPPHKREALDQSYQAEADPRMRYNMLLEFSSYLRQVQLGPGCPRVSR